MSPANEKAPAPRRTSSGGRGDTQQDTTARTNVPPQDTAEAGTTRVDQARAACDRGWEVIAVDRRKRPVGRWREGGITNAEEIRRVLEADDSLNYAILTGRSGLVVLDQDEPGALEAWAEHHGVDLPATYTVTTSKGEHRYYQAGEHRLRDRTRLDGHAVDVRADGYVVGPGSVHETGVIYTVTEAREPATLPDDVAEALRPRERARDVVAVPNSHDVPSRTDADGAWMAEAVRGVLTELDALGGLRDGDRDERGRGWDAATFAHASRLIRLSNFAPSEYPLEQAEREFLDHAPRDRRFGRRALEHKWSSAVEKVGDEPASRDDWSGAVVEVIGGTVSGGDEPSHAGLPLGPADDAEFWDSREVLRAVRGFARSRRIGRWALLGAVLARASAEVPPSIVLPPTRGSVASLNVFIGLCADSGGGKSAAVEAASEVLRTDGGMRPLVTAPGSGEGLLAAYVHVEKVKGEAPKVKQHQMSVLFDVDEIGSLGALASRTNSTLLPFLKSAWSGRLLATQNAEAERVRRVEAHAYRMAVVAGVQTAHADAILSDEGGGFPQRWLWMPTYDAQMPGPAETIPDPEPYRWKVPGIPVTREQDGTVTLPRQREMTLPQEAVTAIHVAAAVANRPIGAPAPQGAEGAALDGHALLSRAKVAALIALLEGRDREITSQDWSLAGTVMEVSDHTRGAIQSQRAREASQAADRQAARAGRSTFIAREAEENVRVQKARRRVATVLESAPAGGMTESQIRKNVTASLRETVPEALDLMESTGEVISEERVPERRREAAVFFRLVAVPGGAS